MAGHIKLELKHDSEGFLIGDKIDLREQITLLKQIKDDIAAIRNYVVGSNFNKSAGSSPVVTSTPGFSNRKASNQSTIKTHAKVVDIAPSVSRQLSGDKTSIKNNSKASVTTEVGAKLTNPLRDSRGRFIGSSSNTYSSDGSRGSFPLFSRGVNEGLSKLSDLATNASQGMEEADPTVKAFREVAEPLGRGMQFLGGMRGERNKERWYRRFWKGLSESWKNESKHQKQERKYLKNIDEQTRNTSKGSFLLGLLTFLPLLLAGLGGVMARMVKGFFGEGGVGRVFSKLGRMFAAIPILGALLGGKKGGKAPLPNSAPKSGSHGAPSGTVKTKTPGKLGKLMGGAKRVMAGARRIPMLGTLIAAGLTYFDIAETEADKTKSRKDKDIQNGKTLGALAGGLGGAAAGAKLGGALGAAIGSVVPGAGTLVGGAVGAIAGGIAGFFAGETAGDQIGGLMGDIFNDMRKWNLSGGITGIFTSIKDYISTKWQAMMGWLEEAFKPVSNGVSAANDYIEEKTGVNIQETVSSSVNTVKGWFLGKTSKQYESGNSGPGTISTGKGDRGGPSYGTYQIASKTGTMAEFLKWSGYDKTHFKGLSPGTAAFNAKWKELAVSDPTGFNNLQHKFIEKSHYSKQANRIKNELGIDVSKRSKALQDMIWSTGTQFRDGTPNLIKNALKEKGIKISDATDKQIIEAVQDYKYKHNERLFSGSKPGIRAGTKRRAKAEKESLLKLLEQEKQGASQATVTTTQQAQKPVNVANVSSVGGAFVKPIQAPAQIAFNSRIEPVTTYLGSNSAKNDDVQVELAHEISQDVSDRKIAYIVTGGYSGIA